MPYPGNEDLPPALQRRLPAHAQDIYRAAFNNAWAQHALDAPERREEAAHRIAWAAVKRRYRKSGEVWVPRAPAPLPFG
jgi:cation transport regulator